MQAATSGDGTFADLVQIVVERLFTQAEEVLGWDAPHTLWRIVVADADDAGPDNTWTRADGGRVLVAELPTETREQLTHQGVTIGLAVEPVHTFDVNPAEALTGMTLGDLTGEGPEEPAVVGAALVTEGWSYPPRILERMAKGWDPPKSPSEYPDRVEFRTVAAVFTDGTVGWVARSRDGRINHDTDTAGGDLGGRAVATLRRVVGVPSGPVPVAAPAELAGEVRAMMLAGAAALLVESGLSPDDAIRACVRGGRRLRAGALRSLLDTVDDAEARGAVATWDEVAATARALAGGEERRWLDWADTPMVAGSLVEIVEELAGTDPAPAWRELVRKGADPGLVASVAERHGLGGRPVWVAVTDPAAVGRNDPCPCGSGQRFKVCCQGRVAPVVWGNGFRHHTSWVGPGGPHWPTDQPTS